MAGKRLQRGVGEPLVSRPQQVLMHIEIACRLRHRNASIPDRPNCLHLEDTAQTSTLHHIPPASLIHLNLVSERPAAARWTIAKQGWFGITSVTVAEPINSGTAAPRCACIQHCASWRSAPAEYCVYCVSCFSSGRAPGFGVGPCAGSDGPASAIRRLMITASVRLRTLSF